MNFPLSQLSYLYLFWISLCLSCLKLEVPDFVHILDESGPSSSLPACSFEQLWDAFGPEQQVEQEQSCWNVRDELLSVPLDTIVNRDSYKLIGLGHHGAVAKVAIQYDDKEDAMCEVVVKTDKCNLGNNFTSCITPGAMNRIGESYLGSEIMGAYSFASLRRLNIPPQGFMPIWGVVTLEGGLPTDIAHSKYKGRPHPDQDIVGIVLPLTKFTPLNSGADISTNFDTLDDESIAYITKNISSIAKTVLPAARALRHTAGLGFAYQGIHMEDVGLIVSRDENGQILNAEAMLYDNTHTSFNAELECSSLVPGACDFCREDWYHKPDRYSRTKNLGGVTRDMDNFVIHLLQPFCRASPQKKEAIKLFHAARHCLDHECIVSTLEAAVPVPLDLI